MHRLNTLKKAGAYGVGHCAMPPTLLIALVAYAPLFKFLATPLQKKLFVFQTSRQTPINLIFKTWKVFRYPQA